MGVRGRRRTARLGHRRHRVRPARACVPLRPAADPWKRDHAGFAGLFELSSFHHLTDLDRAVSGDASSEITLFAFAEPGRASYLAAVLNRNDRPVLADILQPGDIFVDIALVRDLGAGAAGYLTVKAPSPIPEIDRLADHYSRAFRRYLDDADHIRGFDEFHTAIDKLLSAPPTPGTH